MKKSVKSTAVLAAAGMMAAAANEQHTDTYGMLPIFDPNPPIRDWGTSPKHFGQYYAESSRKRKNDNYRKHQAKYHK